MIRKVFTLLNKLLPKFNHVIVQGFPKFESSTVAIANYIAENYNIPVYYPISKNGQDYHKNAILHPKIMVIDQSRLLFRWRYLTARYLFFTHGSPLSSFSKRQISINVWHGILYKKVGRLIGYKGIPANTTVGTSKLTQKMFSEAFDVPESSVFISGYPRNDILLRAKANKNKIKEKIGSGLETFDKVIIWLPTYRKSVIGDIRLDGTEVDNPFYISNFEINRFNQILKKYNAICILKPHPMAPKFSKVGDYNNILFIDDKWISNKGITLYHLVGLTDILISDVSSIIIDYMLMEQPIICISSDFEAYKNSRGFYFDDIENWIPNKVLNNQSELFQVLENHLLELSDPYEEKRQCLKEKFFEFIDTNSTKRLIEHIFEDN